MRRLAAWLLVIPYALGWLAGLLVLIVVVCWLAALDGYATGRGR